MVIANSMLEGGLLRTNLYDWGGHFKVFSGGEANFKKSTIFTIKSWTWFGDDPMKKIWSRREPTVPQFFLMTVKFSIKFTKKKTSPVKKAQNLAGGRGSKSHSLIGGGVVFFKLRRGHKKFFLEVAVYPLWPPLFAHLWYKVLLRQKWIKFLLIIKREVPLGRGHSSAFSNYGAM